MSSKKNNKIINFSVAGLFVQKFNNKTPVLIANPIKITKNTADAFLKDLKINGYDCYQKTSGPDIAAKVAITILNCMYSQRRPFIAVTRTAIRTVCQKDPNWLNFRFSNKYYRNIIAYLAKQGIFSIFASGKQGDCKPVILELTHPELSKLFTDEEKLSSKNEALHFFSFENRTAMVGHDVGRDSDLEVTRNEETRFLLSPYYAELSPKDSVETKKKKKENFLEERLVEAIFNPQTTLSDYTKTALNERGDTAIQRSSSKVYQDMDNETKLVKTNITNPPENETSNKINTANVNITHSLQQSTRFWHSTKHHFDFNVLDHNPALKAAVKETCIEKIRNFGKTLDKSVKNSNNKTIKGKIEDAISHVYLHGPGVMPLQALLQVIDMVAEESEFFRQKFKDRYVREVRYQYEEAIIRYNKTIR